MNNNNGLTHYSISIDTIYKWFKMFTVGQKNTIIYKMWQLIILPERKIDFQWQIYHPHYQVNTTTNNILILLMISSIFSSNVLWCEMIASEKCPDNKEFLIQFWKSKSGNGLQ